MMPSIFGENLFDEFFNEPFAIMAPQGHNLLYGKRAKNLMKTDVRETENSYELDIDLPGFKKDEISIELKEGCLNISAAKGLDKEESDKEGNTSVRNAMRALVAAASMLVLILILPRSLLNLKTASCAFPFQRLPVNCLQDLQLRLNKISLSCAPSIQ